MSEQISETAIIVAAKNKLLKDCQITIFDDGDASVLSNYGYYGFCLDVTRDEALAAQAELDAAEAADATRPAHTCYCPNCGCLECLAAEDLESEAAFKVME